MLEAPSKPFIVRRNDGEYSTVRIGDMIETVWFGNDGTSETVGRTYSGLAATAEAHIRAWEGQAN